MDRGAAIIGALIGLAIGGFTLIYLPMRTNVEECGRLTLCDQPAPSNGEATP